MTSHWSLTSLVGIHFIIAQAFYDKDSVIGMEGPVMMRDLWQHEDLGIKNTRYAIIDDRSLCVTLE